MNIFIAIYNLYSYITYDRVYAITVMTPEFSLKIHHMFAVSSASTAISANFRCQRKRISYFARDSSAFKHNIDAIAQWCIVCVLVNDWASEWIASLKIEAYIKLIHFPKLFYGRSSWICIFMKICKSVAQYHNLQYTHDTTQNIFK